MGPSSKASETLNGRLAMLGALHMTITQAFLGDLLVQVANTPAPLFITIAFVTFGSLAPRVGEPLVPVGTRPPKMRCLLSHTSKP